MPIRTLRRRDALRALSALPLAAALPRVVLAASSDIDVLKQQILALAEAFAGQGDPDFSIQQALEGVIAPLLAAAPPPPVADRLPLLYGAWKQVWGPYDYRSDDRGVDPNLGIDEIYQVVSPEGYYHNVSPLFRGGNPARERIGMLKGRYRLARGFEDVLQVRFVDYPGFSDRPAGYTLPELPPALESGQIENDLEIVPPVAVKLFFGTGALREIYTDHDMRLLYGASDTSFSDPYLYVMTRVEPAA
jgi:hypothetical protein